MKVLMVGGLGRVDWEAITLRARVRRNNMKCILMSGSVAGGSFVLD
jgi:hypothetical protein